MQAVLCNIIITEGS